MIHGSEIFHIILHWQIIVSADYTSSLPSVQLSLDNEASPKLQSLTMLRKGAEFTKLYWKHTLKTGSFSLQKIFFKSERKNWHVKSVNWILKKKKKEKSTNMEKWKKYIYHSFLILWCVSSYIAAAGAAAKSLQSCLTLCDPIDGSSPIPGILQARTLEWVAISFSNAWKWKGKVKSFSRVWPLMTPWTTAYQAPPSMGFSRKDYWSHCSYIETWLIT